MPIYEFKCSECGHIFEKNKRLKEDNNMVCSNCGSRNIKRVFSSPAFITNPTNNRGKTCCGRDEKCSIPPCSDNNECVR